MGKKKFAVAASGGEGALAQEEIKFIKKRLKVIKMKI